MLGCDPSNVTPFVDRLERAGLVKRQVHPHDRRVKTLVVTTEGRDMLERMNDIRGTDSPPLQALTPSERDTLEKLLAKAWAAAKAHEAEQCARGAGLLNHGRWRNALFADGRLTLDSGGRRESVVSEEADHQGPGRQPGRDRRAGRAGRRDAGLGSVAVYAEQDRDALFVRLADEAYSLDGATPADSYLKSTRSSTSRPASGADAVHPATVSWPRTPASPRP